MSKFPNVHVKLVGEDGNAFQVITRAIMGIGSRFGIGSGSR